MAYVHGHNEILAPAVHKELEGRCVGDVIEVPIDGNRIFGPRDESLVFTDRLGNVLEEYRQIGVSIPMENDSGQTRSFIVTRVDDTLTVNGTTRFAAGGRLHARDTDVRDATDEDAKAGGAINGGAQRRAVDDATACVAAVKAMRRLRSRTPRS